MTKSSILVCASALALAAVLPAAASVPWVWAAYENVDSFATAGAMEVDGAGACHLCYMTNRDYGLCRWTVRVGPNQWVNALTGQPWPGGQPYDNISQTVFPRMAIDANRNVYIYSATNYDSSLVIKKYSYAGSNTWTLAASVTVPNFQGRVGSIRISPTGDIAVGMSNFPNPPGIAICAGGDIANPSAWTSYVSWDYNEDFVFDGAGNIHLLSNGDYGTGGDGYKVLFLDYYYKKYSRTMQLLNTPIRVTDANIIPDSCRIFDHSLALDGDNVYTCFRIAGYQGLNDAWMWKLIHGTQLVGPINLTPLPDYGPNSACGSAFVYGKNGNIAVAYLRGTVYLPNDIPHTIFGYDVINDRRSDSLNPGMRTTNIAGAMDNQGNLYVHGRADFLIFGMLPGPAGLGRMTGYVRDSGGAPHNGATVRLLGSGLDRVVYTQPDGSYFMGAVPPGTYTATAWKLGYSTDMRGSTVISPDQTTTVNFTIDITQGTITGFVRDTAGMPMSGVTVTAAGIGTYSTTTGANGGFTLGGVAVGNYNVTASKFGYRSQTQTAALAYNGQTTSLNFTLDLWTIAQAKALPSGSSVQLKAKPVTAVFSADGCLYIEEADRSSGIRVSASASGISVGDLVDVAGQITQRLPDGVNAAERQISATSVARASAGAPVLPIAMTCRAIGGAAQGLCPGVKDGVGLNNIGLLVTVAGRVTHKVTTYIYVDDGSKIPDISGRIGVMVKCPSTPSVSVGNIVAVTGVVQGSIPSGWTTNRRFLQMRDWNDLTIVSTAPTTGAIAGTVTNSQGAGISGAAVSASPGGYSTTTGTGGSYSLSNVAPGTYDVTAAATGYVAQTRQGISVTAGQTTGCDFTLAPSAGVISGYVRDTSGSPLSGAAVSTNQGGYTATSNSDGSYAMVNVATGTYSVTASLAGYDSQTRDNVGVMAGQATTVNFSLTPRPGTISGIVKDTSNNPIAGAAVSTNTGGYSTTTNADGSYALTGVAPGTYSVTASKTNYNSQTKTGIVVNPGGSVSCSFNLAPQPGTISGYVKDTSNSPISGATVATNTGGYSTTSAADGSYSLAGVAPGTYSVTASKTNYVSQTINNVVVSSNQTTTVSFSLTYSPPVEKLLNGGFEGGFFSFWGGMMPNSWGATWRDPYQYPATVWADYNYGGSRGHVVKLTVPPMNQESGIIQVVSGLTPGKSFTFSADAYQFQQGCNVWLAVDPNGGTVLPAKTVHFLNVTGQWNRQQFTGTVGAAGVVTVFLWVWHQWDPTGDVYLDNASLMVNQ